MEKIGIFWGSTSDNTKIATEFMVQYLEDKGVEVDSFDIGEIDVEDILNYENIIIGCPTWNIGELQDDWDSVFLRYEKIDFSNITAAFFGCGDQVGYPYNFLDAIGILAKPFIDKGGKVVGKWDTDHYEFDDSAALHNGKLLGLGLDYDNDDEEDCEKLMVQWLDQILNEFK